MISHLGKMLSLVVGGTWAARRAGEDVFGLAVIGDGGSSTGEIPRVAQPGLGPEGAGAVPHREQSLLVLHADQPSVQLPAAFRSGARLRHSRAERSTAPTPGRSTRRSATRLEAMQAIVAAGDSRVHDAAAARPRRLRQGRLRAGREAAASGERAIPLPAARQKLLEVCGMSEAAVAAIEQAVEEEVRAAVAAGDGGRAARSAEQPHGRVRRSAAGRGEAVPHAAA